MPQINDQGVITYEEPKKPKDVSVETRETTAPVPATPEPPVPATRKQVATKLVAKQLQEDYAPTWVDRYGALHRRTTTLERQFVYENPVMAARMVMSSLPEKNLQTILKASTLTYEWLSTRNQFAGVPGILLQARAAIMQMPEPKITPVMAAGEPKPSMGLLAKSKAMHGKRAALELLDRIQSLPEGEQQGVLAYLSGSANIDIYKTTAAGTINEGTRNILSGLAELFPSLKIDVVGDDITLHAIADEDSGEDLQSAKLLQRLFTGNEYKLKVDELDWMDRGLTRLGHVWEDFLSAFPTNASPTLDGSADYEPFRGFGSLLEVSALPWEAAGAVGGGTLEHIPGGHVARSIVGGSLRGGFGALHQVLSPVAQAAATGVPKPERDKAAEVIEGLLTIILLHKAQKWMSAIKIGRAAPAEISAARLGMILEDGDIANRNVLSMKQAIWKFVNRPVEQWLDDFGGRRFLNKIEALRTKNPENIIGALNETYGGKLPIELIKRIAETPKELVPKVIMDYVNNPGGEMVFTRILGEAQAKGARAAELESRANVAEAFEPPVPESLTKAPEVAWNEPVADNFYTWSPEGNFKSIARTGLDPSKAKGFSAGIHVSPLPTSYPIIGDIPMNLYRIARSSAEWVKREGSDYYTKDYIAPELIEVWTSEGWKRIGVAETVDLAEIARLKVEQVALERLAEQAILKRPLIEYPQKNILRAALYNPTTKIERFLNKAFAPHLGEKKLWDASKLVDELPNQPVLFSPGEGAPLDWQERNADVALKYLRRAGVKQEAITGYLSEMGDIVGYRDFYDWVKRGSDLINQYLPKNTPYDIRVALTRFWSEPSGGRTFPARPGNASIRLALPDVDLLVEATSGMRRAVRKINRAPKGIGHLVTFPLVDLPRFMLRLSTGVLKAPILVLRAPALITRIQLEQMVRMVEYGNAEGFWPGGVIARRGTKTGIDAPVAEDLGGIGRSYDQLYTSKQAEAMEVRTRPFENGTIKPERYHFEGWAENIYYVGASWFDAQFARFGLDVGKMERWIAENDYARRYVNSEVAQGGARKWLAERAEAIRQVTGGSDNLLESTYGGRWGNRVKNPEVYQEYKTLLEKRDGLKDAIRNTDPSEINLRAPLQRELLESRARLAEIEKMQDFDAGLVSFDRSGSLGDVNRLATELEAQWKAGEIKMPEKITLRSDAAKETGDWLSALQDGANAWSRLWYASFRPVGWVDLHGTRGSLYYQIAAKERQALRNAGWDEAAATAHAQVTAAGKVADIMYDLAARTSLHRTFKDIFWFGPAQTEILYTWFVKIPSKSYMGLGHALLAAQGQAVLKTIEALGIVQKNDKGERVIAVPGLEQLFGLTGQQRLNSYNLVSAGGILPGLSTFPSWVLGKMALNYGGDWKRIADAVLPYGPEINVIPRPLVYAMEAAGADYTLFDKLSSALFGEQYESSKNMAFQKAQQELTERGELPPRVEDYTSDDMFRAAQEDYLKRLEAEATGWQRTMTLIRLFGATVAPASITVSTKDRDAWLKYRNSVIDKRVGEPVSGEDGESYNEAQWTLRRKMTEDYVAKHPGAFPYTVSYYEPADEVQYPKYRNAGDDGEYDALYRGEANILPADEYISKFLMLESMRHYSGQRNVALHEISETLDPGEILLNWNKRSAAMDKTWADMDRYFTLVPEAEAYYLKHKVLLHDKYGTPINTFEADRLADTARNLRIIGRQDTGLEAYQQESIESASRAVSALYSESGIFGTPNTVTEKAISDFWENVYSPYRDKRNALFFKANAYSDAGQDENASRVYERLRVFENNQKPVKVGSQMVTPEMVRWGMLTRQDQKDVVKKWATRPPEWLTDYQRDKVYGDTLEFKGVEEYLQKQAKLTDDVEEYKKKHDISENSSEDEWLDNWANQESARIAKKYGPEAEKWNRLSDSTPYARLKFAGETNKALDQIGKLATEIISRLKKDDLSPRGTYPGSDAFFYKEWLYTLVENKRDKNPQLDRALDDLSATMAETGRTYKTGVPLYEALFFGNFMSDFIPEELTRIGGID
jgi:hypothetical protein